MRPMDVIPVVAYCLAVLAHRGGQRTDDQHRGHRHRFAQPIAGHPVGDAGSGCATTRSGVRRHHPALAGHQRPRRHAERTAQGRRRRHQDSVRPQRTGEHSDSQRQRSRRGARRAALSDRRTARPHVGVGEAAVGPDPRQRGEAGADAGQAQRGDGVLEKNRDNIAKALPGLAKFQTTLGETIGNGPYYQAYVPISSSASSSSRSSTTRSASGGEPTPVSHPTMPGPAQSFPFPYNGIPQDGEQWGPPPP